MKLIKRNTEMARNAAQRFIAQYTKDDQSAYTIGRWTPIVEQLREALKKPRLTCYQVDKIIGNTSWTSLHCSECRESAETVLIVGRIGYDLEGAYLCIPCVEKAAEAVK